MVEQLIAYWHFMITHRDWLPYVSFTLVIVTIIADFLRPKNTGRRSPIILLIGYLLIGVGGILNKKIPTGYWPDIVNFIALVFMIIGIAQSRSHKFVVKPQITEWKDDQTVWPPKVERPQD